MKSTEIEISFNLICGVAVGIELVEDEGWKNIVFDLLIIRLMISWK